MLKIIFCQDPLDHRQPDSLFAPEVEAAQQVELGYFLTNFEALISHHVEQAVRGIPAQPQPTPAIYRGWMLKPEDYRQLYEALQTLNLLLINTPEQYRHGHYLPESYPIIEPYTPKTVWMAADSSLEDILEHLWVFGTAPLILKDFVKSQKHYWAEACYIPDASNRDEVERVVNRFLELQGEDLNEGLVFREFVPFEPLADHDQSGMPLSKEFRVFYLDGEPLYFVEYWEQGNYHGLIPPLAAFQTAAAAVQSRFFTMDVARRTDGEWLIVELGDAQVSGLPERADVLDFYRRLKMRLVHG